MAEIEEIAGRGAGRGLEASGACGSSGFRRDMAAPGFLRKRDRIYAIPPVSAAELPGSNFGMAVFGDDRSLYPWASGRYGSADWVWGVRRGLLGCRVVLVGWSGWLFVGHLVLLSGPWVACWGGAYSFAVRPFLVASVAAPLRRGLAHTWEQLLSVAGLRAETPESDAGR